MSDAPKELFAPPAPAQEAGGGERSLKAMPELEATKLVAIRASLVRYASGLLSKKSLRGPIGRPLPEDLASDAIMLALENLAGVSARRKWNPEECSMVTFCRGVIKSNISNYINSSEHIRGKDTGGEFAELLNLDGAPNSLDITILNDLFEKLLQSLAGDDLALKVLKIMIVEGDPPNNTIRETLNCTDSEVENAKRRIYRHGNKITRGR